MPCDLSTAIYIDNRRTVFRTLLCKSSLTGGIDRGMFEKNKSVGFIARCDLCMESTLNCKCIGILHDAASLESKGRGARYRH
jgi:hypothetical protein